MKGAIRLLSHLPIFYPWHILTIFPVQCLFYIKRRAKVGQMFAFRLSCDPGRQVKVWGTWASLVNHSINQSTLVFFIWVKKKKNNNLPTFPILSFLSHSLYFCPVSTCFSSSLHFHYIKVVSWIRHRKRCCFKQSVMSAFLWRNKLSSENKCFESLALTCMCFL